jgi:hypothetical protein
MSERTWNSMQQHAARQKSGGSFSGDTRAIVGKGGK